ncbi:MAG: septum site-determining protein MinC [Chloroflexi bacterium]|nr:MAG: septum site-determining protein MinC [Chloroflexota bacterium]
MDGPANPRDARQPNGAGNDPVQAKVTALLDDVTVRAMSALETPDLNSSEEQNQPETGAGEQPNEPGHLASLSPEVAQIAAQIKSIHASSGNAPVTEEEQKPAAAPGNGAVTIKGRSEGVTIELGKGQWSNVLEELSERLSQAGNFFRGGAVALDVGPRPLLESELQEVRTLLDQQGMMLAVVRTAAERTFEAALGLGLAARLVASNGEGEADVEPAASNQGFGRYFVYHGNLRSGQVLERNEHILLIGDVNPGAEVVSQGDILVWGRMRGIAHAGAGGDKRSVVLALHLDPIQLRIAGTIAIDVTQVGRSGGRWSWKSIDKRPEIAFIVQEQIVIEPWDESKPGGLAAFRRK